MTTNPMDARVAAKLATLAHPAEPEGLAAATMARIARLDEPGARETRHRAAREAEAAGRRTWRLALFGQAAGLATLAVIAATSQSLPDLTSARIGSGLGSFVAMPEAAPIALALAAGLAVYLAGFFAPLGDASRARRRLKSSA